MAMIDLLPQSEDTEYPRMIDFGRDGKVAFKLPVLGDPGVPIGIMSSFGMFYDKFSSGRTLTDQEVAQTWTFFIQTLADTYPDATRQLARLDQDGLKHVVESWVATSGEMGGYSPKASTSSR